MRSRAVFVALSYVATLALGLAVNAARRGPAGWSHVFDLSRRGSFEASREYLPALAQLRGRIARYVSHYAQLLPYLPTHTKGNPPGPVIAMHVLLITTAGRLTAAGILVGALCAPLAYALGRELGGEHRGRVAAALTAFSPAVVLFGVTSVDYAFAALGAAVAWLLVTRAPAARAAGCALAAVASFFSWVLLAIPVWAVVGVATRPAVDTRYGRGVPVLNAAGLTKTVGSGRARRRVLHDVSLTVDEGEIVAVLGRSGSGKSTLLNLLGGLDAADGGVIELAGQRLTGRGARALGRMRLRHIGFVFQQFQLIDECSGLENVLMPTRLPRAPPGGARRAARLIAELGLQPVADHLPHELSGGEQQRFALARALVNDPELVLADEPTGSLDSVNGAAVLELLRGLGDRAVVMVTHEPTAAAVAASYATLPLQASAVQVAIVAAGLLAAAAVAAGLSGLAGCGAGAGAGAGTGAAASGSTRQSTWGDPVGDGQLRVRPGEPLRPRTELGPAVADAGVLITLAHITDAHVLDASSPARVTFLDRLGPPFQSTFRPQETLTAQVLAGAVHAVRALKPAAVIQGGDLIDNDQRNELDHALAVLRGGRVSPGSGPRGYDGVQLGSDADPFYYRPAVDAPRHPRLLRDAVRSFHSPGAGAPVLPVFGDHDAAARRARAGDPVARRSARSSARDRARPRPPRRRLGGRGRPGAAGVARRSARGRRHEVGDRRHPPAAARLARCRRAARAAGPPR